MVTPLPPPRLPPPLPMPLWSSSLSPGTFHSIAPSTSGGSQTISTNSQLPPLPPLPPPPPPSSAPKSSFTVSSSRPMSSDPSIDSLCDPRSRQTLTSESVQNILTQNQNTENIPIIHGSACELETKRVDATALEGDLSSKQSVTLDLPPPSPRSTNEKTDRNVEILCQFISKNGPGFEDMARQREAGNLEFKFLFGGEPGSEAAIAKEYYLWMKNKSSLEYKFQVGQKLSSLLLKERHVENTSSVEPNNLEAASYAPSDSDMDMEVDISQPGEKLAVIDQVSSLKQDSISAGDGIEEQEKDNPLQSPRDGIPTVKLGHPIKVEGDDGWRSNRTFGSVIVTESPFTLLKEYASDDTSEDDADAEVDEPKATLQLRKAVAVSSDGCMMRYSSESKATEIGPLGSLMRDAQCKEHKGFDATLASELSARKVIPGPSSLEKKGDEAIENNVRTEASKQSASLHDFEGKGALKHSRRGVISESADAQGEHTKNAAPVRVDEFGRFIRESASETDSDHSNYNRRRVRRGRSGSPSRSQLDKKRRRSPWRRKERRSRSQSWSPKRWRSRSRTPKRRRSRSRSPFRRTLDVGGNKNKRGRNQMPECFKYLKGRCYQGASCRYLHSDPNICNGSRHYRSKRHPLETTKSSRGHDHFEEKVPTIKWSTKHEVDGEEMQHDEVKQEWRTYKKERSSTDFASKGAIVDEKVRAESVDGSLHCDPLRKDGKEAAIDRNKSATAEESTACLLRTSDSKNVSDLFILNVQNSGKPEQPFSSMKDEHVEHSQAESLAQECHALYNQPQYLNGSSPTSIAHISSVSFHQLSEVVPCRSEKSDEPKDPLASESSAVNYSYHVPQLPPSLHLPQPPPLPPSWHVASVPHASQPLQGYTSVPSEHKFPLRSAPLVNLPSYNVLLSNQHSCYPTPQNPSWSILPAPQLCPSYMVNPSIHSGPTPFQQEGLRLRSDPPMQSSLKISPTDIPSHPQVGSLQEQTYPSMQDSRQPPQHVDDMRPGSLLDQAVAGSNSVRDDQYVNSVSGLIPSSSFCSFLEGFNNF